MTSSLYWNSTPIGRSLHLRLCQNENLSPQLIIEDKVIRSIVRIKNPTTILLIATLISDDESQRLTYVIDRFLLTNDVAHHQLITGEFQVPIQCDTKHSAMFNSCIQSAIQDINNYCYLSVPIELHRFSYLYGQMSMNYSSPVNIDMSFDLLTVKNSFLLTPINPASVQILPTALLKSLNSSTENSVYKTQAHFGYCSLDRMSNKKILLLLENDPQAYGLPLVGIWISGITDIQCAFVWAVCLRYCMNLSLKQRLQSGATPFLLACYLSTTRGQCDFYEVKPIPVGSTPIKTIEYDRWRCSKQISLPLHQLNANCSTEFPYDFEFQLIPEASNIPAFSTDIPFDSYQAILSSPNTNGSLFGFPRSPPKQTTHEQPSWDMITTAPMLTPERQSQSSCASPKSKQIWSPAPVNDNGDKQWKEELIERMQSYEAHFLALTKLVHQLLNEQKQQNLRTTPKKECSKRHVGVQSEPSSPYVYESLLTDQTKQLIIKSPNTEQYQQQQQLGINTTLNHLSSPGARIDHSPTYPNHRSVDILKPIFQYIDKQQQQKSAHSPPAVVLPITNEEDTITISDSNNSIHQQQHVTSTKTTGISFTSNGIQMQFINQQSSTTTVYPQAQSQTLLTSPQKSENNLSIEVHALEMKYLEDEQLAAAIECDRSSQATASTTQPQPSPPQITNKSLSFETQEYLQRYGLFSNENK
ncbi:unnamed protein product [Adineta ricciae]|uniref:STIL N-terminal domain-containing protein n=1 Tax=Adineta ricciae TaxID=249248 RepID=A0A815T8R0_ADIRI|nr:unnamed protein product [Adineta ricciae]CAF1499785.1 unnamed protein product [Adineta ricciae]